MQDHALRVVIEERISELLRWRSWYRRNRWADWTPLRHEHEVELRALVRLAREARRIAAAVPDPMTAAAAWTDAGWTESELAEAFGR